MPSPQDLEVSEARVAPSRFEAPTHTAFRTRPPLPAAHVCEPRSAEGLFVGEAVPGHPFPPPRKLDGPLRRGPLRAPFLQRKTIQLKRGREKEERIFRRVLDSRTCFESSSRWFGKYQPLWALFPSVYNGEINQHEGALSTSGQSHRPFPGSARASNRMAQRSRVISLSRDLTARRVQRARGPSAQGAPRAAPQGGAPGGQRRGPSPPVADQTLPPAEPGQRPAGEPAQDIRLHLSARAPGPAAAPGPESRPPAAVARAERT